MIRVQAAQLNNPQQMTVTVAGPDGANTMYFLDGQVNTMVSELNGGSLTQTYSVLLGPVLTRKQFVQAIATAAITGIEFGAMQANSLFNWTVSFANVDADWDDESGQIELRIEININAGPNSSTVLMTLGYHVTALAQM